MHVMAVAFSAEVFLTEIFDDDIYTCWTALPKPRPLRYVYKGR